MFKKLVCFTAGVLMLGCASKPIDPAVMSAAETPLICSNKAECDIYWQRAQVWVGNNSGYRIQTVTDSIIQTYGPMGQKVELAFNVSKNPGNDGSARIMIAAACDNMFGCRPNKFEAIAAFKQFVRNR